MDSTYQFSLSAILCTYLTIAISGETVAQPIDNCTDSTGIQLGICVNTDNDSFTVLAQQQKQIESSGHPSSGGGSSTLDDQRAQKTADNTPDPRALAYEEVGSLQGVNSRNGPKATLPLARTTTTPAPFLQHHNAVTIKPKIPDASPQRRTISTPPPPSSTPTALACTSAHSGCRTRISSFPPSSRSPVLPKPTSSTFWATTSRSPSQPRVMSGVGVMEPRTWSPPPLARCGNTVWTSTPTRG